MDYVVQNLLFFLRIIVACVCGGILGYERKNRGKGAGIKTHCIVATSAALMMIVSKYCFSDVVNYPGLRGADPARIAAQVISGVGFLGAGMIYFNRHSVKGLTTAAGIWATAGIGLAIGSGMYAVGIFTTLLIICFQIVLRKNRKILHMPSEEMISVVIDDNIESLEILQQFLEKFEIMVDGTKTKRFDDKLEMELLVNIPSDVNYNEILSTFRENRCIHSIDM